MTPAAPPSRPANAVARSEREALCDLMLAEGPDAPTLCAGWTARDLAAHLVIRERRPDAAVGIVASPLSGWTSTVQDRAAGRDFAALVDDVRHGPGRWSPLSISRVDAEMNTIEFFVHHEDVRRAQDGWEPRLLDDATSAALWGRYRAGARFLLRRSPVGVVAAPTDGPDAGREVTLKGGDRVVTLAGPVGEIVLAGYGRLTRGLDLRGSGPDVAAFLNFDR